MYAKSVFRDVLIIIFVRYTFNEFIFLLSPRKKIIQENPTTMLGDRSRDMTFFGGEL